MTNCFLNLGYRRSWRQYTFVSGLLLLLTVGCGSSTDDGSDPAASTGGEGNAAGAPGSGGPPDQLLTYSPCSAESEVGEFRVQLINGVSGVGGQVFDRVNPANILEELDAEGECRVTRNRNPFCSPACASDETCGTDDTCVPTPVAHNVGTITVTGFAEPLELTPTMASSSYNNRGTLALLPEGQEVTLTASGGDYESFSLRGAGVQPVTTGASIAVDTASNDPLELSWDPAAMELASRILVNLNINNHGATLARIECEVADTGELTIPASLVQSLADLGLSGFPTVSLTRQTADSAAIEPGCVELRVFSELQISIIVDGITSCSGTVPCPDGQVCDELSAVCSAP